MKKVIFIGYLAFTVFSTACIFDNPPQQPPPHVCVFHAAEQGGVAAVVTVGNNPSTSALTDSNGNVSVTVPASTPCSDVSVATPNIGSQS